MDNSWPHTIVFVPLHSKKLSLGKEEQAEIPDDSKELGFVQIAIAKGKNKVTKKVLGSWVLEDSYF